MQKIKICSLLTSLVLLFSCHSDKPAPSLMQFEPTIRQASILDKYICENFGDKLIEQALLDIKKYDIDLIEKLPNCFRGSRKLILKAVLIDPSQFRHASDFLRSDKNFIRYLLKIDPRTLKYANEDVRGNKIFMERATFLSRDSLQYGTSDLRNNKLFMADMIDNDSRNYIYASNRLKKIKEFAKMALSDNGMLLVYAPEEIKKDRDLVKIAFNSNNMSIKYASIELKKDKEFLINDEDFKVNLSFDEISEFINDNYIIKLKEKHLGYKIGNRAKNSKDNIIIDRNYIVKWQKTLSQNINRTFSAYSLIPVSSRNIEKSWREDFNDHPELINKIERFFLKREVDKITIDNLETTYLWQVSDKPLTYAFNLYLLKNKTNSNLGGSFADVTSLTAIVQKRDNGWRLSVIEVIFDSEIEMNIEYENGHKTYMLWDLYNRELEDSFPFLIYKTRQGFREFLEVFHQKTGGKFEMIYRIEPKIDLTQKIN